MLLFSSKNLIRLSAIDITCVFEDIKGVYTKVVDVIPITLSNLTNLIKASIKKAYHQSILSVL